MRARRIAGSKIGTITLHGAAMRRVVPFLAMMLVGSAAAQGQLPPATEAPPTEAPAAEAPSSARMFCEQSVSFRLANSANVPEPFRRFLGVWSDAAWDARTCAALIVEDVKPDATASIVYVYGPLADSSPAPGGMLHGTGVIRNGQLLFQNSDGTQFAFKPGIVDLEGHLTTPQGQIFSATFKQTP
jgi:hypothetical protein